MSIDALSWAFNLDLPNSGVKLTLLALANYANDEHNTAFPSQKTIAQKTCLSDRAIRGHLVTLEQLGVISRKSRKREDGTFTTDLFTLNVGFAPPKTSGRNYQRQNLPTAKSSKDQRKILPKPAAESAYQESSLNTTKAKDEPFPVAIAPAPKNPIPATPSPEDELQSTCRTTWKSYADAYFTRYGVEPVRNAVINTHIKAFCKKIPHLEAPHVAAFYVRHNDKYYLQKTHHPSLMSKDAEGLRTQWATGRSMTSTKATQMEKTSGNADAVKEAIEMMNARRAHATL